jgi:hypothetical protein
MSSIKEIDVLEIISKNSSAKILAKLASKKLGIDESKLEIYINKKIENKISSIGEVFSKGDLKPEDYNRFKRLSDVDLNDLNDKIIKDE